MMHIPGLKDWRTTIPAVIGSVASFIALNADVFAWATDSFLDDRSQEAIVRIAGFVTGGSVLALGVNAASNAKVIEKTEERLAPIERRLDDQGGNPAA